MILQEPGRPGRDLGQLGEFLHRRAVRRRLPRQVEEDEGGRGWWASPRRAAARARCPAAQDPWRSCRSRRSGTRRRPGQDVAGRARVVPRWPGQSHRGAGPRFPRPNAVSYYTSTVQPAVLAGKPATYVPADLDAPHSWTYTVDCARTLIAASTDARSWGRAWHVPSAADISVRALSQRLAEVADTAPATVSAMTREQLAALAVTDTVIAEIQEMLYMTERPALLDSADTRRQLIAAATPLDEVLADILRTEQPTA